MPQLDISPELLQPSQQKTEEAVSNVFHTSRIQSVPWGTETHSKPRNMKLSINYRTRHHADMTVISHNNNFIHVQYYVCVPYF